MRLESDSQLCRGRGSKEVKLERQTARAAAASANPCESRRRQYGSRDRVTCRRVEVEGKGWSRRSKSRREKSWKFHRMRGVGGEGVGAIEFTGWSTT
mmetsp:Transcript_30538/g.68973  ORF Transcript_30538/g.68973 Transcript_30538/m.68973 type:complete len:97 (-) Transcript_30538:121-411(-)